jgi:exodeoxyribonuclease-3
VSWNVNGIRAVHRKGVFVPMIEALKPDILCLQETKAEEHESPIDLPDYQEFWSSAKKKGYSGTAIFSKEEPLDVRLGLPEDIVEKYGLANDSYGDPNTEGRVITAEFQKFFVVTAYTPNSKHDLSRLSLRHKQWDPAFLEYVKFLEEEKPVIFCGDLNVAHTPIDLENPKSNEGGAGYSKEEREGIDQILKAGFTDTFRHLHKDEAKRYTWWSNFNMARERNIGWRIDYIFVSKALGKLLKKAEIHEGIMGSDHCPVSITLDK